MSQPGAHRLWYVADAFRYGLNIDDVYKITQIDRWFLVQIYNLVETEKTIINEDLRSLTRERFLKLKQMGFSDSRLAELFRKTESSATFFAD